MTSIKQGDRFGKWTVIGEPCTAYRSGRRRTLCLCRCECGAEKLIRLDSLKSSGTTGCKACNPTPRKSHGKSKTNGYGVWAAMHARCRNPNVKAYYRYGGRGITVCDRWQSYQAFVEDMGEKPGPDHTVERIDNDGDYSPENCRWATQREQCHNTRRNRWIEYNGETKILSDWAREYGLTVQGLKNRLDRGWAIKRALETPPLVNPTKRTD